MRSEGKSLFHLPWMMSHVFNGLREATHGDPARAEALEGALMSRLVLELLDRQRSGKLSNRGLYDFYAFCQQRLRLSHSQILQDLWVLYMLQEKRGGFFVEFGACDGRMLSNTLLLESEYAWTGILAEPDPHWHVALKTNRKCDISTDCVSTHSGNRIAFAHVPTRPELSRVADIQPDDVHEQNGNRGDAEIIEVDTISLSDLLKKFGAPRIVDYISLDTEGSEYAILKSLNFNEYRFRLITVEHAGESKKRNDILTLLSNYGYQRWRPELSRWDDWYFFEDCQ
jgi:FkbM family methyltransferase